MMVAGCGQFLGLCDVCQTTMLGREKGAKCFINYVRARKNHEKKPKFDFFLDFFLQVQKIAVPLQPQMRNNLVILTP